MSFLDRRVPADREWIVIRDRKILWYNFIYLFDSSKFKDKAAMRGKSAKDNILRGGYILQRMTDAYTKGTDTIEKYYDDFNDYGYEVPEHKELPRAIEDLFDQIEKKHNIDLSEVLEYAVSQSEYDYNRTLPERNAKAKRETCVSDIISNYAENANTATEKIKLLLYIQEKLKETGYENLESQLKTERRITTLWISLLTQSLFSDFITHGQMLSLVQDNILEEHDITHLIRERYNDKRDYEWYSEDFLGSALSDETIIRVDDILSMTEGIFKEELGITEQ